MISTTPLGFVPSRFEVFQAALNTLGLKAGLIGRACSRELTISLLAVVVAFPIGITDIFKREQEQNHLAFLILNRHNVQETPERIS